MRNKGIIVPVVYLLASALFFIFDWTRFDLAQKNNKLAVESFVWFIYILYGCIGVLSVVYLIKKKETFRWKTFIPFFVIILTTLYFAFIPLSNFYLNIDYVLNFDSRTKIIRMLENGQIQDYQTGENKYLVPYRLTSHTGAMFVQQRNGVTKVMFYVHFGLNKSRIIVYTSFDKGISTGDFDFLIPTSHFDNIRKMDRNWYSAIIESS